MPTLRAHSEQPFSAVASLSPRNARASALIREASVAHTPNLTAWGWKPPAGLQAPSSLLCTCTRCPELPQCQDDLAARQGISCWERRRDHNTLRRVGVPRPYPPPPMPVGDAALCLSWAPTGWLTRTGHLASLGLINETRVSHSWYLRSLRALNALTESIFYIVIRKHYTREEGNYNFLIEKLYSFF